MKFSLPVVLFSNEEETLQGNQDENATNASQEAFIPTKTCE